MVNNNLGFICNWKVKKHQTRSSQKSSTNPAKKPPWTSALSLSSSYFQGGCTSANESPPRASLQLISSHLRTQEPPVMISLSCATHRPSAGDVLRNSRPSQMRDNHCGRNASIYLVLALKRCSYAALRGRFKDGHCHGREIAIKLWCVGNLVWPSHIVAAAESYVK